MKNLFISYDLMNPGQKYAAVEKAINACGPGIRVHFSLWFIKSDMSAKQAADAIQPSLDSNDKLIVIEADNAAWLSLNPGASDLMLKHWAL